MFGGTLGIIIKKPSKNYIALMFALAAGAMLGISFFELLPSAVELGGILHMSLGLLIGIIFVFFIRIGDKKKDSEKSNAESIVLEGETRGELPETGTGSKAQSRRLSKAGFLIFIGIMLHNLPEGLVIGAGGRVQAGLIASLLILLHNIPEGMAMALPLKASGAKNIKIVGICFLAGLPTVLGALVGYLMGANAILTAYSLSLACGAMLCIVFAEMLPAVYEYSENKILNTVIVIAGAVFALVLGSVIQ